MAMDGEKADDPEEEPSPSLKSGDSIRCPGCWGHDLRSSFHQGLMDNLASMFSLAPYRCRVCGKRFYRHRRYLESLRSRDT
jgi:hypothetical protein